MRVWILGAGGILGRALAMEASRRADLEATSFSRAELDLADGRAIDRALRDGCPDVVINAAGLTKARCGDHTEAQRVNADGPRALAAGAELVGTRLVHVSTDCVFRGDAGPYDENAVPDADDAYGRSKALGEVTHSPHLTVRTSFVGHETRSRHGLLAWALEARGAVPGYTDHRWSGLTAPFVARTLLDLATRRDVTGLLHLHGEDTTKCELLRLIVSAFRLPLEVVDQPAPYPVDRRLRSARLAGLGVMAPPLAELVQELARAAA